MWECRNAAVWDGRSRRCDIKLPDVVTVEGGIAVSFDARGEVAAPLGRAVIRAIGGALQKPQVPGHITNLNARVAGLRY